MKRIFNFILTLTAMLTMAQTTWAQEAAVYDLVTEVPTVDDGQATNWDPAYDYGNLVDGNTSTIYSLSKANPWVEFHYSRAFVPKKYILWTGDYYSFAYNPATWTIKAKLNKTDEWTTIATVDNSNGDQLPEADRTSKEFSIESNTKAYKYFRFEATRRNNGTFQLGELQFKEATPKVELTWNMSDQSSMQYTISGNSADFVSNGNTMRYTWTGTPGWNLWGSAGYYLFHKAIENQLQVTFPYLTGKVTKVEINNINFSPAGMSLSVSNGTANLKNGNSDYFASTDDTSGSSVTFTGEIDVNTSNYLRFTFVKTASGNVSNQRFDFMNNGSIKVTLVKEQKADLGHTFTSSSITASGSMLTATCTSTDADHVALYGASHHFTLTLNAADGMAEPSRPVYATITPAVSDFNEDTQLGATCTVEYAPQGSSSWTTSAPYVAGNYTARATVRINSTNYVLTTNFSVIEGHYITNDYPQFSVNKTGAMAGENITVTFTPKMGESLTTLTVTGDNTSLSIGSGITDNGDNTYTFAMPNENVTLGATFTFPMNADNFAQDGDTYTIKNADGWNYFCQRIQYDANLDGFSGKTVELAANISVTTMAGMVHPFKGTFDGKGNTLTFNRTADAMYTAPFQNTDGATISNLHVTGLIEGGTNSYLGGLVGSANGNLTIRDCHVSTQISTTFDSNTLSANVGIGGFVGLLSSHYNQCHITGCVFDGLIYNPNTWNQTYGCGGFIGAMSQYGYAILEDCLFIEGQYDNNGNKCELLWGYDNNKNSTFFHRSNNQGEGTLKNCFFVATHFLKQGSPAVESADAPDNFAHFGTPTDHGFLKVYGHTMVFDGKYYTPTYGDLVETYSYSGEKSYIIEYDDMPLGIKDVKTKQRTNYLRYNRPFTRDKAVTIMLPFDFTKNDIRRGEYDNISEGKFYEFAGIEEVPFNMWIAVMKEVGVEGSNETTETTMKANTPYLFMPGEDAKYLYFTNGDDYYQGFDIFTEGYERGNKQTEYDGSDGTYSWNKWNFKGTYQPRYWSDSENSEEIGKVYGFAGATKEVDEQLVVAGDFVRVKSGAKIRPTSCYLEWVKPEDSEQEPNSASARRMTRSASNEVELPQRITVKLVGANGETTSIGEIDTKTGDVTFDGWYTIDGVRLSGKPSKSGLYINNGRKVIIK
ncbi:hypothetical protein [Prevotella sp. tf2-5]|uniref:hypothetical protein n=1 Tax=Prevotella sp. tf2-5 TaxID=1761889 RepID=UPI0008E5C0FA|nr:hypothetical protein [Prevotella sp. tf2-5]SFO70167.1 hypothetical protein SAMN04487852_105161 [Prevotella sp. tf2-5]